MHVKGEGKQRWENYVRKMAEQGEHRFINILQWIEEENANK